MRIRGLMILVGMMASATVASGQAGSVGNGLVAIPYRSYISINPLGVPFDIFSIEVESGIAQGMTLGASASHTEFEDARFTSADFKYRYYPSEIVLRGVSLGASLGMLRYSDIVNDVRESLDAPTFGVLLDYNWLLGAQGRFVLGTGIGAKRLLVGAAERKRVDLNRAQFTARFTVGVAF